MSTNKVAIVVFSWIASLILLLLLVESINLLFPSSLSIGATRSSRFITLCLLLIFVWWSNNHLMPKNRLNLILWYTMWRDNEAAEQWLLIEAWNLTKVLVTFSGAITTAWCWIFLKLGQVWNDRFLLHKHSILIIPFNSFTCVTVRPTFMAHVPFLKGRLLLFWFRWRSLFLRTLTSSHKPLYLTLLRTLTNSLKLLDLFFSST